MANRVFSLICLWPLLPWGVFGQGIVTGFTVSTVAGGAYTGDGRPAIAALLALPNGLAADRAGNVYISDSGAHTIRQVTPDGLISTLAGTGSPGFAGDGGPALAASLDNPYGLVADSRGGLLFADLGNQRVRRIDTEGRISTIAGGGQTVPGDAAIPALEARLEAPRNLALDSDGNLYVSDFYGHRVYQITPQGMLQAIAGTGVDGFDSDGGLARQSRLSFPAGVAVDRFGILSIAESGSHRVRIVVCGRLSSLPWLFPRPIGLTIDLPGVLWICDQDGTGAPPASQSVGLLHAVDAVAVGSGRMIYSDGKVVWQRWPDGRTERFAGSGALELYGDGGPAVEAHLEAPVALAPDAEGGFYVAEEQNARVRYVDAGGLIHRFAGSPGLLKGPRGLAVDGQGTVFIADTGNNRLVTVTADGLVTGLDRLESPDKMAFDSNGNLYVAETGADRIARRSPAGVWDTVATVPAPRGLAVDGAGSLYTISAGAVLRIHDDGTQDVVAAAGGPLRGPQAVAVSARGDVFVADAAGDSVWLVSADGSMERIAGENVRLDSPSDVVAAGDGSLLVCDTRNHRVLRLSADPDGPGAHTFRLVNAASLTEGAIAPEELLALPYGRAGTEVWFDGEAGTVVDRQPARLLVQAPATLVGRQSSQVEIRGDDGLLGRAEYVVAEAAPGLFATGAQVFAMHQDGTLNSQDNPARQQMVVSFYGTGEGLAGGQFGLRIGDADVEILYAGPAPELPGIFQVNGRVPGGFLPAGALPVVVIVGGAGSQPGVSLWVR